MREKLEKSAILSSLCTAALKSFSIKLILLLQLLDSFSIPTVLVLSWLLLRVRYRLSHIGGFALALMSVVTIVWVDVQDGKGGVSAGGNISVKGHIYTCKIFPFLKYHTHSLLGLTLVKIGSMALKFAFTKAKLKGREI